jgi:hypothetical protein
MMARVHQWAVNWRMMKFARLVAAVASDSRALKRRLGMKRVLKEAWRGDRAAPL